MSTCRRAHAHKFTAKCPKCNYTSRIPETSFHLNNSNSVHSQLCPKHRLRLERVIYIPKNKKIHKGTNKLKKWQQKKVNLQFAESGQSI
jgi:hypothetical protein